MDRTAIRSRDIAIVGYEPKTQILEIAFRNGGVYHYTGVPEAVYQELMKADSQGTYFAKNIKEQYSYQKIR